MKLHVDRLLIHCTLQTRPHPEEPRNARRLEGWATTRLWPTLRDAPLRGAPQGEDCASVGCPAARQIERRTGGKSAKVRCKPGDHLGHFLDFAEAVHRDLGEHVLDVLLGHLA